MKDLFVSYEQALALKELGFDEPCFTWYWDDIGMYNGFQYGNHNKNDNYVSAPLRQQVFRFFRERYAMIHHINDFLDDETDVDFDYEISIIGTDLDEKGNYVSLVPYSTDDENRKFKTYERAETALIDDLIKLVKNK